MDVKMDTAYVAIPQPSPTPAPAPPLRQAEPVSAPAPVSQTQGSGNRTPESSQSIEKLETVVQELNRVYSLHQRHVGIRRHEATGRQMVTVYNTETNEVIREIPPESILDAFANLMEMAGLIFDKRG
jgi:uncharacterized FlaG/YvyC family protein